MNLTESERAEFIMRANATFDPGLWSAEDLPLLRAAQGDLKEKGQEDSARGDEEDGPVEFDPNEQWESQETADWSPLLP